MNVEIYNQKEKEWIKKDFQEVGKLAEYVISIKWEDYLEIFIVVNQQIIYYVDNEADYGKLFKMYNAIYQESIR